MAINNFDVQIKITQIQKTVNQATETLIKQIEFKKNRTPHGNSGVEKVNDK